jgi:glycosyltransferase involved in cell wall biosynthesis
MLLKFMRAIVAHHYWDSPGGGQLVSATTAKALADHGLDVALVGTMKFTTSKYIEWYGIDLSGLPTFTLPISIKSFGLWSRLYLWIPLKKAIKKHPPVIVFTDEPTYKKAISLKRNYKLVEYIHFPIEITIDPKYKGTGLAYGEDPYITERYSKFPLNIYWKVYAKLYPIYARENPFQIADIVLTNSKWTADVIKLVFGEKPIVLNPPLPPNIDIIDKPKPFEERRPWVVMLGRFTHEKRYHWVVTEVLPKLQKEVPEARFIIFGGAATPSLQSYKEKVKYLASKAGLKVSESLNSNAQLYLVPNAPRSLINQVMDEAKAFFHATINEHWGIAVAEAMARGLIPVVHKSGGAWTDLVEEGRYGLGYETATEAVEALSKAITQPLNFMLHEKINNIKYDSYIKKLFNILSLT